MPSDTDFPSPEQQTGSVALEELFKNIADHSHIGIFLLDKNGKVFYWNQAAIAIWGRASLAGTTEYSQQLAWDYETGKALRNEDWAGYKTLVSGKPCLDEMLKIKRGDGEYRVVLNSAIPILDHSGKLSTILILNHDVTELKASEAKREELSRIVSHDLKNPLYAVQMASQVLQAKLDTYMATGNKEKILHYIEAMKNSAGHCLGLIKDILDADKEEKKPFKMKLSRFPATELFEPIRQIYEPLAEQKGQTLSWNIPRELEVQCDKERLGQVLSNIVGNAIKFTPSEGEIRVSVTEGPNEIIFEIRDNGPGISNEHLKKIFHKNYQVQETPAGTGLGLYIAETIVDAHNGKIWADSDPGRGTTFYFSIPR